MSKHSFPFYKEQLEMILAVTKMLNEHSGKVPIDPDYYFRVQLVEAHEDKVIGEWSDEVGPDCWEFSLAPSQVAAPTIVNQTFQLPQSNVPGARTVIGIKPYDGKLDTDAAKALRIQKYQANSGGNVQLD